MKKQYSAEFKLSTVLESYQRDTTIEAVSKKFQVSRSIVDKWRTEFKARAKEIYLDKRSRANRSISQGYKPGEAPDDLKRIIGEQTVTIEILKKVQGLLN